MMKWIVWSGGVLVALTALVLVVGSALPEEHTATVTRPIPATQQTVWTAIMDFDGMPAWRTGVDSVARNDGANGLPAWTEFSGSEALSFEILEMTAPTRLVSRIVGEGLMFGGTWAYSLAPSDGQTTVTITEHGEVYNAFARFVSRFVIGHESTMTRYLSDLESYVTR